jgi:hypothetical protein
VGGVCLQAHTQNDEGAYFCVTFAVVRVCEAEGVSASSKVSSKVSKVPVVPKTQREVMEVWRYA